MAKVIFTDEERAAAKAGGGMLYVYFSCPPENHAKDGGTYKCGVLTRPQAEDLDDAVTGQLRKFRQGAA